MSSNISERNRQSSQYSAEDWQLATVVHSAIAGVSVAATIELAISQNLSNLLIAASVLFALALPSSVSSVVMLLYFRARGETQPGEAAKKHQFWSGISKFLALMAQLACFGGFLLLFWHLNWIAGVAFASISLIAVVTLAALGRK